MIENTSIINQTQKVTNFRDLIFTPFQGDTNAICWSRKLVGDFAEIVKKIPTKGNITEVDAIELQKLPLSLAGQMARDIILEDIQLLTAHGASSSLNLIQYYDRDEDFTFFPTDVYSYHVDRSPVPTDTFLCTYFGNPSEILPNSQAVQKILIPEIRKELNKLYDGPDEDFLSEYFFDLHYQAKSNAVPINLGVGNLWRLAVDHPGSQVLPCVHRAPVEKPGEPRLLLIC
jgi:hypothetical protein